MSSRKPLFFTALTVKHNGRANRIITDLKISKAFDNNNPPNPPFPLYDTKALWDTGATKSCLTPPTVAALELVPVGSANVIHAGGVSQSNTYLVNFFLPNSVAVKGVLVSEMVDPDANVSKDFGAIIGMDIITLGDFSITNANDKTCMSFRTPAIAQIDYVLEANKIKFRGARRNEPCPCGKVDSNGKPVKFKHCHEPELTNA